MAIESPLHHSLLFLWWSIKKEIRFIVSDKMKTDEKEGLKTSTIFLFSWVVPIKKAKTTIMISMKPNQHKWNSHVTVVQCAQLTLNIR